MAYEAGRETIGTVGEKVQTTEKGEGMRLAQGRFLDELPGVAFVAITLIWVIGSFAGLMWRALPVEFVTHAHQLVHLIIAPPHTVAIVSRVASVGGFAKRAYTMLAARNPG